MVKNLYNFFVVTVVVCLLQPASIKTMAQRENPLFGAIKNKKHELLNRLLLKAGADIHTRNKKGTSCIEIAVETGNSYALQKLFQIGIDVNAKNIKNGTILAYALKKNNEIIKTIILGQQPNDLTGLKDAQAYNNLINATTKQLLKEQFKLWTQNTTASKNVLWYTNIYHALRPLITYGTTWQFKYTAEELRKLLPTSTASAEFLDPSTRKILEKQKNRWNMDTVIASLCIRAINSQAIISAFRLLSLCAQQGIVDRTVFQSDKKELAEPWQSPLREIFTDPSIQDMPYLHEALEPIRIQERLNKIQKSTDKLKDITIRFNKF